MLGALLLSSLVFAHVFAHVSAHVSPHVFAPLHGARDDCPQGAEFLRGVDQLRGACAIAAIDAEWIVCAPETIPSTSVSQLIRVRADGSTNAVACNALSAVDVALASDGAIAVADAAGVVRVLDASCVERVIGDGALEEPGGVCWTSCGGVRALAVSDRRLRAVLVFGVDGVQLQRIGDGVLRDPRGIAAAADGTLYVADRLADCLWKFAADTAGMLAVKPTKIGEIGANPGQFSAPCDVVIRESVDGTRCLFVAEELNHRVQILDRNGAFIGFFGMHSLIPRLGEGRIHYPRSVALSADGNEIAVAEAFEDRVQIFRLMPTPTPPDVTSGSDLISSHFGSEIACDNDLLALLDVETEAVAVLDARVTPPIHMSIMGGGGSSPNRFIEVSAIAVEPAKAGAPLMPPRVWVADRGSDRIDVFEITWDRSKEPYVDMFMPKLVRSMDLAKAAQRFHCPSARHAMRMCDITDILFAPSDANRVMLLDAANLAVVFTDARLSQGAVELLPAGACTPMEIAIDADGQLAIADPVARAVYLRSATGVWRTLTSLGEIAFVRPSGVAFTAANELVVSDSALDACLVAHADGSARRVGERGILDEQFWDPQAMTMAPNGMLVIDRGNHRYQRFGEGFSWNLTGSLGRYYDRKRKGSPGTPPLIAPTPTQDAKDES